MGIPLTGAARSSPDKVYATAVKRGAEDVKGQPGSLRAYFDHLYEDAATLGINADVLVAQWDLETGSGTSAGWVQTGNPAGLGMFDDGSTLGLRFSPEQAARAHVVHMCLYLGIRPDDSWIKTDARWDAAMNAGYFGSVTTTSDLGNGRWATDPNYATKLPERYTAYFGAWAAQESGETPMALAVKKKMLPTTNRNHPETLLNDTGDLFILVHETGNTSAGANALMHANFVCNGGGESSVSFHLTVDENEAYQMMELKWIGYHASDGCDNRTTDWGCFRSIAIETCVHSNNVYKVQTRKNLAELIAMIVNGDPAIDFGGINHKRFSVDRVRTHNDSAYDGKWCPTYMLNDHYIPILRAEVASRMGAAAGEAVSDLLGIRVGATIKATEVLNVRGGVGTGWVVRYQLQPGEQAYVKAGPKVADGYTWYDVVHTTKGPGWAVADWMEVVAAPTPAPAPTYAPASVVSELAALRKEDKNTVAGLVIKNGVDFFTVWDQVEAITETPLLQFAFDGAKEIGPRAKKGDRRWVSHAFTADDGKGYYYDEHAARLVMADWKRIGD